MNDGSRPDTHFFVWDFGSHARRRKGFMASPINSRPKGERHEIEDVVAGGRGGGVVSHGHRSGGRGDEGGVRAGGEGAQGRSEERRVGKECRAGGWACREKERGMREGGTDR